MDKLDREIVSLIVADSRVTAKNIAAALGISESETEKRISALETSGAIVRYTAITNVDDEEGVEALIEVKVTPMRGHGFDAIAAEICLHDEVQNLYLMSGAYDLAVIVKGRSLRDISRFVSEKISTYESVISTATHFILKKYKIEGATIEKSGEKRQPLSF